MPNRRGFLKLLGLGGAAAAAGAVTGARPDAIDEKHVGKELLAQENERLRKELCELKDGLPWHWRKEGSENFEVKCHDDPMTCSGNYLWPTGEIFNDCSGVLLDMSCYLETPRTGAV